jgi:CheY-like chemotaxis protein
VKSADDAQLLLVAEDYEPICRVLRVLLGTGEFQADFVRTQSEVRERVSHHSLVLLDNDLCGEKASPAFLEDIRTRAKNPGLKIVAFSAQYDEEARARFASMGFDDCFHKPFTRAELTELLEKHLPPAIPG